MLGPSTQKPDLRLLNLLHGLHDKDGWLREVKRLLKSPQLDEPTWSRICEMGTGLAPEVELFSAGISLNDAQQSIASESFNMDQGHNIAFDRRRIERRGHVRRVHADRRERSERRQTNLAWLGNQRRVDERRQSVRRREDQVGRFVPGGS